jgi:hypothetical protein
MIPVGVGAGVVGLAGFAAFAGLGLASQATYDDLEARCAPLCGDAERSEADGAETQQALANVGLVVGIVGVAAGVTLIALGATGGGEPAATIAVGPRGLHVRCAF